MAETDEERTKRYAAKLAKFSGVARESRNHGGPLKSLNEAMVKGPGPKREEEIAAVRDSLILHID